MQGDFLVGEWLIHPRVNAMEREGSTTHLEPKIMQVLVALATDGGEVVTREQLRGAVWPDVFVGEDVLIRAISELRRAFADDPRSPTVIETIPKVGYRLIAPVTRFTVKEVNGAPHPPASSPPVSLPPAIQKGRSSPAGTPVPSPSIIAQPAAETPYHSFSIMEGILAGVLLLGLVAIAAAFLLRGTHNLPPPEAFLTRPLTTYPGSQLQPALSPDGTAVAFVWKKDGEERRHIYVKELASEAPSRLTSGDSDEMSPAWSPDGQSIAFVRLNDQRASVVIVPAVGGSEREVYVLPTNNVWEYGGLAWTRDGNNLIFPEKSSPDVPSALADLNLTDRSVRLITNPPSGWDGDYTPKVSPDGTELAFVRGPQSLTRDVYIVDLRSGALRRLTNDSRLIVGLAWVPDGSAIVFSSNRSGTVSLWRVSVSGGTPEHEPFGNDGAYTPSIARQGDRLVYSHGFATWSIMGSKLDERNLDTETAILTASEQDSSPRVSPTAPMIVFQSWRSGSQEIWTARADGADPVQLTFSGYSPGSPSWSPDGRLIAFDARPGLYSHLFVIGATGGAPRMLTNGNFNDIIPNWSADGHSIYFGSTRSGSWQIWKIPSDGSGAAQQVTTEGGMVGMGTQDGRWVYFSRSAEAGLWRVPVGGGPERKICDGPPMGYQNYWSIFANSVYSLIERKGRFEIERVDPETGQARTVHILKRAPTLLAGLSLTPDGKQIVFAELVRASSGLTLVDHFQ